MSAETFFKLAWLALAGVHVLPALVLFMPSLAARLYGVDPAGDVGVLIVHRGALFLAIVVLCLFAAVDPVARRATSLAVAISVVAYLILYVWSGQPQGSLRTVALVDLVALVPLGFVLFGAWRPS